MSAMLKRHWVATWIIASALFVIPEAVLLRGASDTRPICEITEEWISAHVEDLPTTYDGIVAFPVEYRKGLMGRLLNSQKVEVWATQLERAAVNEKDLTDVQRRWLTERAKRFRSEGMPNPDGPNETQQIAQVFHNRLDLIRLTQEIGPSSSSLSTDLRALWLTMVQATRRTFVAEAHDGGPTCDCATVDDWCPIWNGERDDYYSWCEDGHNAWLSGDCLDPYWWGCGTWQIYYCDGQCAECEELPPGSGDWFCGLA